MLRIIFDNIQGQGDLSASDEGHDTTRALETAVILSLFCDARSRDDDGVAEGQDRRGWWADAYAVIPDDAWGSRLWLLERSKVNTGTLLFARQAAEEALAWLIEDNVARDVQVETSWVSGRHGFMRILVRVFRPDDTAPQIVGPWEIYYAV